MNRGNIIRLYNGAYTGGMNWSHYIFPSELLAKEAVEHLQQAGFNTAVFVAPRGLHLHN